MQNFRIHYSHPWLLLLLIPAIALTLFPYFKANKKYRKTRNRILSMLFHGLAITLAINLLAGISFSYEKPNLENELIVLVDTTDSNAASSDAKNEFVQSVVSITDGKYRLGVVKFGHGQVLSGEMSYDMNQVLEDYLTSEVPDGTATDLASAIKYASTLFKNPETAKIVVLSDGIETDNNVLSVIKAIAAEGIKVDTVLYPNEDTDEIQVYSVKTPDTRIILGDNFITELTVRSNLEGEKKATVTVFDNEKEIGSTPVLLDGKREQTFEIALSLAERGMHELRFEITCEDDTVAENNSYRAFINLEAFDNILIVEGKEGEGAKLAALLCENFSVTDMSFEEDLAQIPRNIEQMAEYEQIILVNVAYSDMPAGFEEMLNQYVYDLGGGLFTVGGSLDDVNGQKTPHAYNRNDLASSNYFQQMLPIKAIDFTPPIAVMIVVDASASMSMGKLDAAKEGAEGCLDALSDRDFCGVMSFQTRASEELEILPVTQKDTIRDSIKQIGGDSGAHGGTIFSDAIMRAGRALSVINNVERKHIILVTDGNPGDQYDVYSAYIQDNYDDEITMSIVTINNEDASLREQMTKAATLGGGKYYNIKPAEMHKIPETMRNDLALEAVAEINYGEPFHPTIKDRTPAVAGIESLFEIPELTGYYGTVAKKDAFVPLMGEYVPIYAEWRYGKGNVGSFMCDLSGIWSQTFMEDVVGKTIITNIVNSIFPMEDVRADSIGYVLKSDNYHYQLGIYGIADTESVEVSVTPISDHLVSVLDEGVSVQMLESKRRFQFIIKDSGLYEIVIKKLDESGAELSRVVLYEAFSYSEEYNTFTDRAPIGEELMTLLAEQGKGVVIGDPAEVFASFSPIIKKTIDPRIVLLILSIVFVLLDIAARKFKFKWPHEIIRERKRKKAEEAARSSKTA